MSVHSDYLNRVVQDIADRIDKVIVNGNEVEVVEIIVNGKELIVNTERVDDISRIESARLLDDEGNIIIQRNPNRPTESHRSIELRFEIGVE